jgi:ribosomal-protein-alanine N-acetyltransferase
VSDLIRSPRLDLRLLSVEAIDAVLAGDGERVSALVDFALPEGFPDEGATEFLAFRRSQLVGDPAWAPWLARAIVRRDDGVLVGTATFHGPPGINDIAADDAAEVGYTILPEHRNRGYATEAAWAMMEWAHHEHGVRRFISGIAPDNAPSLRVIHKLGFQATGIVEDGELIFELCFDADEGLGG